MTRMKTSIRWEKEQEKQKYLNEKGIQTLIHYPIPAHKQLAYKEFNNSRFPITEQIQNEILSLHLSSTMSSVDLEKIVKEVNLFN